MKILLTNDDGYLSEGLMLLCKKLSEKHQVVVVAPDGQRSATSHAVNFHKQVAVKKLDEYCGATDAYICSGTPADCVKFADSMLDVEFDLLVSGPNNGDNYGCAIFYSGTVAAAEEGVLCGIKSIALSRLGFGGAFGSCVEYLAENVEKLREFCRADSLINVNVPDLPMSKIKGVKVCRQSDSKLFDDYFVKSDEADMWMITGDKVPVSETDSDVFYADQGYVTVTPLSVLRTDYKLLDEMKILEK